MQDFRTRRATQATIAGDMPGLTWYYKVDGHLLRNAHTKQESETQEGPARGINSTIIGDIGFADDTSIVGKLDEVRRAGKIFATTLNQWEESVNENKTERLRINAIGRKPNDVRNTRETAKVRYTGGSCMKK